MILMAIIMMTLTMNMLIEEDKEDYKMQHKRWIASLMDLYKKNQLMVMILVVVRNDYDEADDNYDNDG